MKLADLDPSERAVAHEAERMTPDVEALTEEDLEQADDNVDRPGEDTALEQAVGLRR